jgi:FMN-dependent NADH-azoreductase
MNQAINIVEIAAGARRTGSSSRALSGNLVDALRQRHGNVTLVKRDLADGLPLVDAAWIEANFTPDEDRTAAHREALAISDELVGELNEADVIVIAVPMYNFNIPAALKAWIDMIARARLTFRYTENGPRGLLDGKKAYVVITTGGVPIGSPMDFATPYLRHALGFVGIDDVELIAADGLNSDAENSMDAARAKIAEVIHGAPAFAVA